MWRTFSCAILLLLIGSPAAADSEENSAGEYSSIIERNPFGLRPPRVFTPRPKPPAPPAPKSKLYLTGIIAAPSALPSKRAYLVRVLTNKPSFISLSEGESFHDIEILAINEKDRTVKIRSDDHGEILLSFKTHALTNSLFPRIPPPAKPRYTRQRTVTQVRR